MLIPTCTAIITQAFLMSVSINGGQNLACEHKFVTGYSHNTIDEFSNLSNVYKHTE